jgi:hypothetical protein
MFSALLALPLTLCALNLPEDTSLTDPPIASPPDVPETAPSIAPQPAPQQGSPSTPPISSDTKSEQQPWFVRFSLGAMSTAPSDQKDLLALDGFSLGTKFRPPDPGDSDLTLIHRLDAVRCQGR